MADVVLARKYSAFISYRHADNRLEGRRWAEWLHQAIETYEVPHDLVGGVNQREQPVPASLFPVFRDEEELPADADLSANIRRALENSDALIVLCSPQACESRFVHEEILYFKELGHSTRILSILLEGEPNASDDPGKQAAGFTAAQECLPLALRIGAPSADGTVDWEARAEPIAADVRPQGLPEQGWTTPAAYRSALLQQGGHSPQEVDGLTRAYAQRLELAVLKIVAGLLGVPLGLLTERDKARQLDRARRQAARLRRLVAIFVALTAVAVAAGVFAWTQMRRADEEAARELRAQKIAQEQTRVAEEQTLLAEEQTQVAVKALQDTREAQQKERAATESERKANDRRRQLLVEASTSDRLAGLEAAGTDKDRDAFAHFARAITYDPASTVAAEAVFTTLNTWSVSFPKTIFRPAELPARANPDDARFTADGNRIFIFRAHDRTSALWGVESGRLLIPLKDGVPEESAQLCEDGQHILTTARSSGQNEPAQNLVRLWDAGLGKLLATVQGLTTPAVRARLSPDGQRIVTVSQNLVAQVWDVASERPLAMLGQDTPDPTARINGEPPGMVLPGAPKPAAFQGAVYGARFSADGQRIVSRVTGNRHTNLLPSGNSVRVETVAVVWNAATGALLASLEIPTESEFIYPMAADADRLDAQFSADGRRFLCPRGRVVYLADAANGKLLATLAVHTDTITSARFSPDGSTILTASQDRTVRLWNAENGALVTTYEGHRDRVNSAEFNPDGKRFVTASSDRTARIYEQAGPNGYRKLTTLQGHEDAVNSARFSPDGRNVVTTSSDGTVRVWNSRDAAAAATFPPVADLGTLTDDNPDDDRFQHSPAGGRLLTRLAAEKQVVCGRFSIDGRHVFAGGGTPKEGLLQAWEVAGGKLLFNLPGHGATVNSLDVSLDGKLLVTASSDKTARVWQTDAGQPVSVLRGHRDEVFNAEFRRDGQRVVTSSKDGTIRLWNTANGELVGILPGASAYGATDGGVIAKYKVGGLILSGTTGSPVGNSGYSGAPAGPRFTADGEHITVGARSIGGSKREYTLNANPTVFTLLPPAASAPPEWFGEFLLYLGQRRFNESGELEDIGTEDCLALRDRLRKKEVESAGQDTPYLRLLRRLVPLE